MSHWLGLVSLPLGACTAIGASTSDAVLLQYQSREGLKDKDSGEPILSTVVEVVPIIDDDKYTERSVEKSDDPFRIRLHPFLEEFLVHSALKMKDSAMVLVSNESIQSTNIEHIDSLTDESILQNSTNHSYQERNSKSIFVIVEYIKQNAIDFRLNGDVEPAVFVHNEIFSMQKVDIIDCVDLSLENQAKSFHLSVTLQFICSTSEEYDECFSKSIKRSDAKDTDCGVRGESMDGLGLISDDAYLNQIVRENLESKLIKEGSVVSIAMPPISFAEGKRRKEIFACFMVEKIVSAGDRDEFGKFESVDYANDLDKNSNTTSEPKLCYRLGTCDQFSIDILSDLENNYLDTGGKQVIENNINREKVQRCPGYDFLVEEIVNLAKITHPSGAPSAVLLTGCAGVGKTRLATAVSQKLSDLTSHKVRFLSAKDIILAASSFMDENELVNLILKDQSDNSKSILYESNDRATASTNERVILVIDDLDVVIDADQSEESSFTTDYECVASFNAIVRAIDNNVKSTVLEQEVASFRPLAFILGVCRTDAMQLTSKLVKVGRFEKVVTMPTPTELQRREILKSLLSSISIDKEEKNGLTSNDRLDTLDRWAHALSSQTGGCVASDLNRICIDAQTISDARKLGTDNRSSNDLVPTSGVTWHDIKEAARSCVPSQLAQLDVSVTKIVDIGDVSVISSQLAKKEIYNISWREFGGYNGVKERIYRTVVGPWRRYIEMSNAKSNYMEGNNLNKNWSVSSLGNQIPPPSGVIFHGPPGTGKSLAAQCLASALSLNVINVRAADLLDKWLGGSEATIRSLFARARSASPCILFFDEIDSIATNREDDVDGSSDVHSRILSTLLNEMDGVSSGSGRQVVLVLAATNRLHAIDAALLRPGRLEEHIFLDKPNSEDSIDILRICLSSVPLDQDVSLEDIAELLKELDASGADIHGVCKEACLHSMRYIDENTKISDIKLKMTDFDAAINLWKR